MSCSLTLPPNTQVLSWDTCDSSCKIDGNPATCADSNGPFTFLTNLNMIYADANNNVNGPGSSFDNLFRISSSCSCESDNLAISEEQIKTIGNNLIKAGNKCVIIYDNGLNPNPNAPWSFSNGNQEDQALCSDNLNADRNRGKLPATFTITYFVDNNGDVFDLPTPVLITLDPKATIDKEYVYTGDKCGILMNLEVARLDQIFPQIPPSSNQGLEYSHVISVNDFNKLSEQIKKVDGNDLRLITNACNNVIYTQATLGIIEDPEITFSDTYFSQNGLVDLIGQNPRTVSAVYDISSLYYSSSVTSNRRERLSRVMLSNVDITTITQRALVQYLKDVQNALPQETDIVVSSVDNTLQIRLPSTTAKPKLLKMLGKVIMKILH